MPRKNTRSKNKKRAKSADDNEVSKKGAPCAATTTPLPNDSDDDATVIGKENVKQQKDAKKAITTPLPDSSDDDEDTVISTSTKQKAAVASAVATKKKKPSSSSSSTLNTSTTTAATTAATTSIPDLWKCLDRELRQNIGTSVKCGICLSTIVDPVRTPCVHSFCKDCVLASLCTSSKCPECKSTISRRSLQPFDYLEELASNYKQLLIECGFCPSAYTSNFTTLTQKVVDTVGVMASSQASHQGGAESSSERCFERLAVAATWKTQALPVTKPSSMQIRENNLVVSANQKAYAQYDVPASQNPMNSTMNISKLPTTQELQEQAREQQMADHLMEEEEENNEESFQTAPTSEPFATPAETEEELKESIAAAKRNNRRKSSMMRIQEEDEATAKDSTATTRRRSSARGAKATSTKIVKGGRTTNKKKNLKSPPPTTTNDGDVNDDDAPFETEMSPIAKIQDSQQDQQQAPASPRPKLAEEAKEEATVSPTNVSGLLEDSLGALHWTNGDNPTQDIDLYTGSQEEEGDEENPEPWRAALLQSSQEDNNDCDDNDDDDNRSRSLLESSRDETSATNASSFLLESSREDKEDVSDKETRRSNKNTTPTKDNTTTAATSSKNIGSAAAASSLFEEDDDLTQPILTPESQKSKETAATAEIDVPETIAEEEIQDVSAADSRPMRNKKNSPPKDEVDEATATNVTSRRGRRKGATKKSNENVKATAKPRGSTMFDEHDDEGTTEQEDAPRRRGRSSSRNNKTNKDEDATLAEPDAEVPDRRLSPRRSSPRRSSPRRSSSRDAVTSAKNKRKADPVETLDKVTPRRSNGRTAKKTQAACAEEEAPPPPARKTRRNTTDDAPKVTPEDKAEESSTEAEAEKKPAASTRRRTNTRRGRSAATNEEEPDTGTAEAAMPEAALAAAKNEIPAAAVMPTGQWAVNTVVNVESRTWPGVNKPGGVAKITKINADGSYNVKYILGGRESNVDAVFVSSNEGPGKRVRSEDELPKSLLKELAAQGFDTTAAGVKVKVPPKPKKATGEEQEDGGNAAETKTAKKQEPSGVAGRKKKPPANALQDTTNRKRSKAGDGKKSGKKAKTATAAETTSPSTATKTKKTGRTGTTASTVSSSEVETDESSTTSSTTANSRKRKSSSPQTKGKKKARTGSSKVFQKIEIPEISNDAACKVADERYQSQFQKALASGTIHVVASNLADDEMAILRALCSKPLAQNVRLKLDNNVGKKTNICVIPTDPPCRKEGLAPRLRTVKAMCSTLAGIPIVPPSWIASCGTQNEAVPPSSMVRSLPTKTSMVKQQCSNLFGVAKLAANLEKFGKKALPLAGHEIHLCGAFPQNKRSDITALSKDAGAKLIPQASDVSDKFQSILKNGGNGSGSTIVLACQDKPSGSLVSAKLEREIKQIFTEKGGDLQQQAILVVDSSWIIESITCGKALTADGFSLTNPKAKALWQLAIDTKKKQDSTTSNSS